MAYYSYFLLNWNKATRANLFIDGNFGATLNDWCDYARLVGNPAESQAALRANGFAIGSVLGCQYDRHMTRVDVPANGLVLAISHDHLPDELYQYRDGTKILDLVHAFKKADAEGQRNPFRGTVLVPVYFNQTVNTQRVEIYRTTVRVAGDLATRWWTDHKTGVTALIPKSAAPV